MVITFHNNFFVNFSSTFLKISMNVILIMEVVMTRVLILKEVVHVLAIVVMS